MGHDKVGTVISIRFESVFLKYPGPEEIGQESCLCARGHMCLSARGLSRRSQSIGDQMHKSGLLYSFLDKDH